MVPDRILSRYDFGPVRQSKMSWPGTILRPKNSRPDSLDSSQRNANQKKEPEPEPEPKPFTKDRPGETSAQYNERMDANTQEQNLHRRVGLAQFPEIGCWILNFPDHQNASLRPRGRAEIRNGRLTRDRRE